MNNSIQQTLLTTRPFKYLTHEEIDLIVIYCEIVNFKAHELILQQGQKNNRLYIILTGCVQMSAQVLGYGRVSFTHLNAGKFVGAESLIENEVSMSTVIAETETECFVMTQEYFHMLSLFLPEISFKITTAIIENVSHDLDIIFSKIKAYMHESDMGSSWFNLDEVSRSYVTPKSIKFIESKIKKDELFQLENLKSFTKKEFNTLLDLASVIEVDRDRTLIAENKKKDAYYIIVQGAIEASIMQNKKRAKVAILGPGEILGDICYLDQCPSVIHHTTRERVILLEFTAQDLESLRQNHILIWYKFYNLIGKSFIAMEKSADKLFIRFNSENYNR